MANHKSAIKRIRQTKVKTARNRFYKTRLKNISKEVLEAVNSGDKDKAKETFKKANSFFHKCVSKGVLKKATASRKVSRLNSKVKSIAV